MFFFKFKLLTALNAMFKWSFKLTWMDWKCMINDNYNCNFNCNFINCMKIFANKFWLLILVLICCRAVRNLFITSKCKYVNTRLKWAVMFRNLLCCKNVVLWSCCVQLKFWFKWHKNTYFCYNNYGRRIMQLSAYTLNSL